MKKILLMSLILVSLFIITACGNKLSEYAGTYKLDYYKYVGDSDTAKETDISTITLNSDGTGKSIRDGLNIDITWSISDNNITIIETYMGIKLEYNGTINNNKIDIFNGDKDNQFTVEKVYVKE